MTSAGQSCHDDFEGLRMDVVVFVWELLRSPLAIDVRFLKYGRKAAEQQAREQEILFSLLRAAAGRCVYGASNRVEAGDSASLARICCIGKRQDAGAPSPGSPFLKGRRGSRLDFEG